MSASTRLRIGTYNLRDLFSWVSVDGRRKRRRALAVRKACAEIILRSKVDVLALQEVGDRQALEAFEQSYLGGIFPHRALSRGSQRGIHSAVLSRRPVSDVESVDLPLLDDRGRSYLHEEGQPATSRRPLLRLDVDVDGEGLRLYVLHLKSPRPLDRVVSGDDGQTLDVDGFRRAEARAVAGCLRAEEAGRVVVLGDLNDEDGDGSSVRPLIQEAGLIDPMAADLPPEARWTARWRRYGTRRFDYLLLSKSLEPTYVRGSAYVDRREPAAYASDHRLVRLDLRLPGRRSN